VGLSKDKITIFNNRQASATKKVVNLFPVPVAGRKEIADLHRHTKKSPPF